ncbi:MAG TPA: proline dehydrogenase family protein [Bacteroidota bacterium]
MGLARSALLWVSDNQTLRQRLPRYGFVRRAVRRFMPGEELADALRAAGELKSSSINTILTRLGENITEPAEAEEVRDHYLDALPRIKEGGLDAYLSVKLTQLGLDLSEEFCLKNLTSIIERADALGNMVWIDMEQSKYVDRTISVFKHARSRFSNVGLCLQAYLYRTEKDLDGLLPLRPAIRLVKGAYAEPADAAYPKKSDVDANYQKLAGSLLASAKNNGGLVGIATHDPALIRYAAEKASEEGLSKSGYEYQLLYGIRTEEQLRLAREGYRVRSLISYGTFWFPWYVRRLAERPANVWFVVKSMMKS